MQTNRHVRDAPVLLSELFEQSAAAVVHIAPCCLKIAGIPRVGNVAGAVGEIHEKVYLRAVPAGAYTVHVVQILSVHADDEVEDKPMSLLPQIWTDYKKDELANIYKGKGTQKEKESVYEILFAINASQNATWEKIKQ